MNYFVKATSNERLQYKKYHLEWTLTNWKSVLFSDKSRFVFRKAFEGYGYTEERTSVTPNAVCCSKIDFKIREVLWFEEALQTDIVHLSL